MIYLLAYLAMTVAAARWLAPHILDSMSFGDPDSTEVVMSRALALCVGLLWPLVLLGVVAMWKAPKSRAQLKQDVAARDARIEELERELGIGQK